MGEPPPERNAVYLMISTYLVPLDEVAKVRDEHLAFLDGLVAQGTLVAAGRQDPPVGGMVLLDVADEATAREVMAQDPYVLRGAAEYEARGWAPTVGVLKGYIKS
ncbi:YciI family protein [Actinoplanes subtropicus]|uniref:YciI family protein n=1 Tax=Actinoplanes subtropicus TaxID=543632 RepID=UPI001FE22363|nr:YciI family protein [Actinoplanes subtropicus]